MILGFALLLSLLFIISPSTGVMASRYQHTIDVRQILFQGGSTSCATLRLEPIIGTNLLADTSTNQPLPGPAHPVFVVSTLSEVFLVA